MADILTIPRSNALRLVNTGKTGYATKRGGFDERLYIDEFWAYETWLPYNQYFDTNQTIRLQIITNYKSLIRLAYILISLVIFLIFVSLFVFLLVSIFLLIHENHKLY